ncbi:MAG TPA: hypothetical protein VI072_01325 [Polyangiaceae bacterium]
MRSTQSSSSSRSFRYSTLRSISVVFSGALLACSLAAGCGDDEEGNGGRGGRGGSGGRDASAGSGGGGGLAGGGGSSGSSGADASAGTGGTAGDASTSEAGDFGDAEAGPPARMELRSTSKLGTVLQANGRTLYFFGGDAPAGENTHPEAGVASTSAQANCSSDCLRPFHAGSLSLGFGMSRLDFGEFKRRDGQWQSTYRGWPLYSADTDTAAGQLTADGQDKLWHAVAVPFYSVIIRRSTVSQRRRDASPSTYEYTYLADGAGMSLYMYWDDLPAADGGRAVSGCSGNCLVRWPPKHHGDLKIVSSLSASDFGFLRWTPDYEDAGPPVGEMDQLTYKGWLMYYWVRDYAPGNTTGHCVPEWSLAEIDGNFTDC